jgi:hypothetical protein
MNLLAGTTYDPAAAVTKATSALLAMTAVDTVNLRLTVAVPPSGRVLWKVDGGALHGAATFPAILVGVMEGATVRGRKAPECDVTNLAATSFASVRSEGLITGLVPAASLVLDLAYAVETIVAATGWKYGGPNDATANNAFGGITFTVWDPSPVYTPASGAAPTTTVSQRIDTLDDFVDTEVAALVTAVAAVQADTDNIQTRLPAALVSGRMDASVGAMAADVITATATAADFGAEVGTAVWATGARALTDKAGFSLVTAPLDAAGTRAAVGLASADLDTQLSGINAKTMNLPSDPADQSLIIAAADVIRSDIAALTSPDNASIAAIKLKTDNLPAAPASTGDVTTVGAAVAAVAGDVTAVKAKTDPMAFTVAGQVDVNLKSVANTTVTGSGSTGDPWGA